MTTLSEDPVPSELLLTQDSNPPYGNWWQNYIDTGVLPVISALCTLAGEGLLDTQLIRAY